MLLPPVDVVIGLSQLRPTTEVFISDLQAVRIGIPQQVPGLHFSTPVITKEEQSLSHKHFHTWGEQKC